MVNIGPEIRLLPRGLSELAGSYRQTYAVAQPFEHCVIDNFLEQDVFDALCRSFPGPDDDVWFKFGTGRENRKLQSRDLSNVPWIFRLLFSELNGVDFVSFLEDLTAIDRLIPDPHLFGGGLHQTLSGGHLGVHVDYNFHARWNLDRRLNAILYLNDVWEDHWGGHLEFWDREMKTCVEQIEPVGNRLVVFNTTEWSWHGHPEPLATPPGRTRKSVAMYYYSNGRPDTERAEAHNTIFKERPGEVFARSGREVVRDLLPETLARMIRPRPGGGRS
jgi:hypothetical protein